MALINLEIEVPGTKTCDISALKRFLTDSASKYLEKASKADKAKDATEDFLTRCCGSWTGNESAEDIIALINEGKTSQYEPLTL